MITNSRTSSAAERYFGRALALVGGQDHTARDVLSHARGAAALHTVEAADLAGNVGDGLSDLRVFDDARSALDEAVSLGMSSAPLLHCEAPRRSPAAASATVVGMTAGPVEPAEPRDPGEDPAAIFDALPLSHRAQFRAEYDQALDATHDLARFRQVQELLRQWRLRAIAYARPGYEEAVQDAVQDRTGVFARYTPPQWEGRV